MAKSIQTQRVHKAGHWRAWSVGLGLVICFSFSLSLLSFDQLEAFFFDNLSRLGASHRSSARIVLLVIDQNTVEQLGAEPTARDHLQLLKKLDRKHGDGPLRLAYVLDPQEIEGDDSSLQLLANRMATFSGLSLIADNLPRLSKGVDSLMAAPFDRVVIEPGPITSDRSQFARDGVTRRMILSFDNQPSFHLGLANELRAKPLNQKRSFQLNDSVQSYIRYQKPGSFQRVSFVSALKSEAVRDQLRGRVVLVGRETNELAKDYALTAVTKDLSSMSRLEIQAHALETLLRDEAPMKLGRSWNFFITLFFSSLTLYLVMKLQPQRGIFLFILSYLGFATISFLAFWLFSVWVSMAQPTVAMVTCYYFFIPYRLIREHKKSWEYYKKNQLLTQVEELKSNFLKMMSHDLKTPLARIYGLCEVVEQNSGALDDRQVQALNGIKKSATDLTEFVGNILSLGRIESREMKLQTATRDLNALLEQVVRSIQPIATEKRIEIICDFEPLFSLRLDEDLMKQVFTNLIENAIKYSPINTKIMITTEEDQNDVIIEIADQGLGIAEEDQAFIFEKFYRTRQVLSKDSPGTGLGLYLVKYFIELHGGSISIDSEIGQGSTFTVRIPKNLRLSEVESRAEKRKPNRVLNKDHEVLF